MPRLAKDRKFMPQNFGKEKSAVPDKALKVRDVMDRYTKGIPIPAIAGSAQPVYVENQTFDSPDMNKLRLMDFGEQRDFARSLRVNYKDPEPQPEKLTRKQWAERNEERISLEEYQQERKYLKSEQPSTGKATA